MNASKADMLRFPLDGSRILLGRDPSCAVRVHGMGTSRVHASLVLDPAGCIVTDENSSFGLRVNDTPVDRRILAAGDEIAIGVCRFTVGLDEEGMTLTPVAAAENEDRMADPMRGTVVIGRDSTADLVLAHPLVSRVHATAVPDGSLGYILSDQKSTNGTFVNGRPIDRCIVGEGDVIQIGPFRLFVEQGRIVSAAGGNRIRLEAFDLTVRMKNAVLLDRVTLSVPPGEFVAVLGMSGAGKSTLVRALCGRLRVREGKIFANGLPLRQFLAAFNSSIGYVSQENLLHPELTVAETFYEQALVRLPRDSTPVERAARIDEVITLLELDRVKERRVSKLSGGEAKRVHLGVELLASPALIVLDEPLAGLDPGLVRRFMELFRRIADRGQTLLMTTHTLERIDSCDRVVFVHRGRIAYAGQPSGLETAFGSTDLADVYERVAKGTLPQPARPEASAPPEISGVKENKIRKPRSINVVCQFAMLARRYFRIAVRDRRNFLLLLLQAPAIALFLGFVFRSDARFLPLSFYFCVTISAIWISGINAAQEIAREWMLLQREHRVGLSLPAYLTARISVTVLFAFVQGLLFWLSLAALFRNFPFSLETLLLTVAGTVSGGVLGLCVSALSRNVGRAITVLPLVFIPQIFFSGILIPFDRMSLIGNGLSYLTFSRPVFSLFKQVSVLERPIFECSSWPELSFLNAGLIALIAVAVHWQSGRER